jgi:hypothetical protein
MRATAAMTSQITPNPTATRQFGGGEQADKGRNPLAALEAEPDREAVADKGESASTQADRVGVRAGDGGVDVFRRGGHEDRKRRLPADQEGDAALPMSRRSVRRARSLRPVRSTLVAPILPEPMLRMSPSPASLVMTRPKGIEPSR